MEVWGVCSLPDTLTRRLPPPAPPLAADFDLGMRSYVRKVVEEGGKATGVILSGCDERRRNSRRRVMEKVSCCPPHESRCSYEASGCCYLLLLAAAAAA